MQPNAEAGPSSIKIEDLSEQPCAEPSFLVQERTDADRDSMYSYGCGYFVDLGSNSDLTSGYFETHPSMAKWSRENLDPQQWAFTLKNRLLNSSASTFFRNCSRDEISIKNAMPTSKDSVSSPISIDDTPSNVYRDQLSALSRGIALWNPNPPKDIYNNVSIGDVGYLQEGTFIRMFNVMLPWDHPSNKTLGNPTPFESLDCGPFSSTLKSHFDRVNHYSRYVSVENDFGNVQTVGPDE